MHPVPPARVDAIVLAGGLGTRLREVMPDRQKVTAPVGGLPFISRLITWLGRASIDTIVLAAGHRADDVKALAAARSNDSPHVLVNIEAQPLGTGGAARAALHLTTSDPVLVLNGDSFAGIDIPAFREFHAVKHAAASLALVTVSDPSRYGTVELGADSAVVSFREKQEGFETAMINAGIYLFDRATLQALPAEQPLSLERDLFPGLIGHGLYAKRFDASFIDIGTPASLQAAKGFFRGAV